MPAYVITPPSTVIAVDAPTRVVINISGVTFALSVTTTAVDGTPRSPPEFTMAEVQAGLATPEEQAAFAAARAVVFAAVKGHAMGLLGAVLQ